MSQSSVSRSSVSRSSVSRSSAFRAAVSDVCAIRSSVSRVPARVGLAALLIACGAVPAPRPAQAAPVAQSKAAETPAIAGKWFGKAVSDAGDMNVQFTVKWEQGKFSGEVGTAHGAWPITQVTRKDDVWTVEFSRGEGNGSGSAVGKITGDTFAGDWHNAPMAEGTFDVKRTK